MTITTTDLDTPVGPVRIAVRATDAAGGEAVVACCFVDHWDRVDGAVRRRRPDDEWREGTTGASEALGDYLDGDLGSIADLDVEAGGSAFQVRVWNELRRIPPGETRSYLDVARSVGQPTATRAVGTANGRNPVWLIVPCHRVVRADATLGGYGGGVERKAWLLDHERSRR